MNIILFDTAREHGNLLPLTFTRPIADLRLGIDTLRENGKLCCRVVIHTSQYHICPKISGTLHRRRPVYCSAPYRHSSMG